MCSDILHTGQELNRLQNTYEDNSNTNCKTPSTLMLKDHIDKRH